MIKHEPKGAVERLTAESAFADEPDNDWATVTVCADDLRTILAAPQPEAEGDLREAAQAVVDRWDSPLWKDAEPTTHVINRLRQALAVIPTQGGGND